MTKPFDPVLYEKDDNAKDLWVSYLQSAKSYKAWINPDQYGIDVLAEKNGLQYSFEVEVKHNWKGNVFPFSNVHFSARKLKFANDQGRNFFIMLNHERDIALAVSGKTMLNSAVVTKNTIYTQNERFVEVPVSHCLFVQITSV